MLNVSHAIILVVLAQKLQILQENVHLAMPLWTEYQILLQDRSEIVTVYLDFMINWEFNPVSRVLVLVKLVKGLRIPAWVAMTVFGWMEIHVNSAATFAETAQLVMLYALLVNQILLEICRKIAAVIHTTLKLRCCSNLFAQFAAILVLIVLMNLNITALPALKIVLD